MIDRLFARFGATYGSRFADMWRSQNIDEVKKCWADELRIFSVEQIGHAVTDLKTRNFPPTLPEFLQLCESARRQHPRITTPLIESSVFVDTGSADVLASKAKAMDTMKRLGSTFGAASNAWANKILLRHEAGEDIPTDSLRMARKAVA